MQTRILILLLFLAQLNTLFPMSKIQTVEPSYVWIDQTGEGRNVYAYFRNEFQLIEVPQNAIIYLYAKSLYNLFVNGTFVNFGPIRSYETQPYYDSINIAPYLKTGQNVIAVKVHSIGIHTYQIPMGTAGFIAWGNIQDKSNTVSLATPGNWICRKALGYNPFSPRFSFAQGPVEILDNLAEPDNFKAEKIKPDKWMKPVLLKNQSYFGKLRPRTIPLLTNDAILPKFVVNRLNLSSDECVYNISSYYENTENPSDLRAILCYSYIYSNEEKDVNFGFSWGKYWINGQLIEGVKQPEKPFRSNAKVRLKKGWNSYFSVQEIIWSNLDGMLAVPPDADLQFSIRRKLNDTIRFALTEPIEKEKINTFVPNDKCPENPEKLKLKWLHTSGTAPMLNPAKAIAWLNKNKLPIAVLETENIIIPANTHQAVTYDFGSIHLGRIFLNVEAPAGTVFDLVWSEDLNKDSLVTLYNRFEINAIARFISDGSSYFETFRPFGMRYLQVGVSNHSQPVILKSAGLKSQIYDFEKTGSFSCSDPLMNDIWEMGWRTLRVCAEDTYIDTPFRERGHYVGDLFPEFATTLAVSGDPRLAKQSIRMFNQQYSKTYSDLAPTIHSDYTVLNIIIACWYIRQFNDLDFAREVYPIYANYLRKLHKSRQKDDFYRLDHVFLEWINIDKSADLTAIQSYVYAASDNLSHIANMLGQLADASEFKSISNEIKEIILTKSWDEKSGNFVDGFKNNKVLPTRHVISSSLASVWKIPSMRQEEQIQKWFNDAVINIGEPVNSNQLTTPYGGFYVLASLYQAGNVCTAEKFIRKHWGKMVIEGNDLTWEDFNRDGKSTISHAWSSSPTYYMSSQVLGVDLGFPGYLSPDTIYIRPQSESVLWAKGSVPHPKGLVTVHWQIQGDILFLRYSAPAGVPVKIEPRGRLASYKLKLTCLTGTGDKL